MTARVVDVRLVLDRDDLVRVYVEGRPVTLRPTFGCYWRALSELARAVWNAAHADGRTAGEALSDPRSSLYRREKVARRCPESPADGSGRCVAPPGSEP